MARHLRWSCIALTLFILTLLLVSRQANGRASAVSAMPVNSSVQPPPHVVAMIQRACADCHSAATRWPWYARIPPGSWLIKRDVEHAKQAMNFSELGTGEQRLSKTVGILSAICVMAKSGRMPPLRYRLMHANAGLSGPDTSELCNWTDAEAAQLQIATSASRP